MKKVMFFVAFSIFGMTAVAQTVLNAGDYVLEVEVNAEQTMYILEDHVNPEQILVERTNTNVAVIPGEKVYIQLPTGGNILRVINQNNIEVGRKTLGL